MMTVTRLTKRSGVCVPETLIAMGTFAPLSGRIGTSNSKTPVASSWMGRSANSFARHSFHCGVSSSDCAHA